MEKKNRSTFYITLNTNSAEESMKEILESAFEDFYDHVTDFVKYMKTNVRRLNDDDEVDCESAIEVGDKYHRVHLHALLTFVHGSYIQLNVDKMRTFFARKTGNTVYLQVTYVRDNIRRLREYLEKTKNKNK